jgi:Rrf2 family transcriptional regulator, nitric oxide-sensitive transcriptional repressor
VRLTLHTDFALRVLIQRGGYLDTVRGRNGGIRLMREPRHINIGQVVRDTEDQLNVIGCLERSGYCCIERVCVLRALRDATEAFLAVLDTYTLADLVKPQKALSSLLLDRHISLRPGIG